MRTLGYQSMAISELPFVRIVVAFVSRGILLTSTYMYLVHWHTSQESATPSQNMTISLERVGAQKTLKQCKLDAHRGAVFKYSRDKEECLARNNNFDRAGARRHASTRAPLRSNVSLARKTCAPTDRCGGNAGSLYAASWHGGGKGRPIGN